MYPLTFMPISMCERSAKGTSLVTSSHSNTAKLHMSADLLLMSSGLFCRAENQTRGTRTTIKQDNLLRFFLFCNMGNMLDKQKDNHELRKKINKYLQGPSMLKSTFDQDTGRRILHLPCLFWLSCPHQSVNESHQLITHKICGQSTDHLNSLLE